MSEWLINSKYLTSFQFLITDSVLNLNQFNLYNIILLRKWPKSCQNIIILECCKIICPATLFYQNLFRVLRYLTFFVDLILLKFILFSKVSKTNRFSTDFGRPMKPNFWAWTDKLGRYFLGSFGQVQVFHYSTIIFTKTKPLYPHPKYLFGIAI